MQLCTSSIDIDSDRIARSRLLGIANLDIAAVLIAYYKFSYLCLLHVSVSCCTDSKLLRA